MHSVSAVGEQYLDLVSVRQPGQVLWRKDRPSRKGTVPAEIGPALDAANRGLAVLPKEKIGQLLDETAQAVGGLGPALQRLVDATQAIVGDFKTNIDRRQRHHPELRRRSWTARSTRVTRSSAGRAT